MNHLARLQSHLASTVDGIADLARYALTPDEESMPYEQIAILTMLGIITLCALTLAAFCLSVWMRLRNVNLPRLSVDIGGLVEIERRAAGYTEPHMEGF